MLKNKLLQLFQQNATKKNGIRSESSDDSASIYLYDAIGDWYGVSAKDFAQELSACTCDTINIYIDSPGGDVFEARAMATSIKRCGKNVVAHIDGLCASAATTVAMACSSVEMATGTRFMIHKAWTLAIGNCDETTKMAELLSKIDDDISADYAAKTGKGVDEIMQMMAAETWLSAQEALDMGFADSILGCGPDKSKKNAIKWDLSAYANAPKEEIQEPIEYDRDSFERPLKPMEMVNG